MSTRPQRDDRDATHGRGGDVPDQSRQNFTRRRFLKAGAAGAVTAGAGMGAWAFLGAPHDVEVVRVSMPLRGLPESLVGTRLVQISDLHVGPIVSNGYLRHCLKLVSSLEPDIVAVTGDFVTYDRPSRLDEAVSLLADLQPGKLATVAVTGNHDFGSSREGFTNQHAADSLTEKLDGIGLTMLRNTSIEIDGLRLLGVDDFWGPTHELEDTLSSGDVDLPSVMLCHNPDVVDQPGWENFQGWILSGHTHGGQVRLPFCNPPILPIRNKNYIAGEVLLPGRRTLYVNRGLGYLRKVRLNVRPEITVFELTRAV